VVRSWQCKWRGLVRCSLGVVSVLMFRWCEGGSVRGEDW